MKKITHKKCTHKSVQLCNEGLAFQYTNYRKRQTVSRTQSAIDSDAEKRLSNVRKMRPKSE